MPEPEESQNLSSLPLQPPPAQQPPPAVNLATAPPVMPAAPAEPQTVPISSQPVAAPSDLDTPTALPKITAEPTPNAEAVIAPSTSGGFSPFNFLKKILPSLMGVLVILGLIFGGWQLYKFIVQRSQPITLVWWGLWEEQQVAAPIIKDYEKSHPNVKISYQKQSPIQYRERLQSALARGEGPDIFRFHNTWTPMLKNDLAALPSTVMDEATFGQTFYPVALKDLKLEGSLYGLPLEFDGLALYYNEDLLQKAQITPPKTWEDLLKAAQALTQRDADGKIVQAGIALGTASNVEHFSDILALMLLQNNTDFKNLTSCFSEAGREYCPAADALTFYTSFSQGNKIWDDTLPNSIVAFSQGKVAMIFAPSWEVFTIKQSAPNLKFKITPVPQLSDNQVNWASFWVEGVAKRSKYQTQAWDFLKYLTSKEVEIKLYSEESKIRLFGEPYSRKDLAETVKGDPYVGPFISGAPNAKSFPMASRTYDNGLNDKMIKYFEDAVNSVNKGVAPKSAIETVSKGMNQVFQTYGISPASP